MALERLSSNSQYFIDTFHFSREDRAHMAETLTRELAELGVL